MGGHQISSFLISYQHDGSTYVNTLNSSQKIETDSLISSTSEVQSKKVREKISEENKN